MRLGAGLIALGALAACSESHVGQIVDPANRAPGTESAAANSAGDNSIGNPIGSFAAQCAVDEEAVFSCATGGREKFAVCGVGRAKAEFRFADGESEVVLSDGRWARAAYSGGGEAQIAFVKDAATYVVFSRTVRTNFAPGEPNYPAISDGVVVIEDGAVQSLRVCDDPDVLPIQYQAAERIFPLADQLFTYETSAADPH